MDKFIKEIQNRLLEERKEIEEQLKKIAQPGQTNDDWNTNFPKFDGGNLEEACDEVEAYATLLSISEELEKKLKDIDNALDKIKKGAFGLCENCNQKISQERLKIYPTARLCRKCQR